MFARAAEDEYQAVTAAGAWRAFCAEAQAALAGADGSVLGQPPSYNDYRHFFNSVLTPGFPGALPPVESLYRDWQGRPAGLGRDKDSRGQGYYLGDSARHMQAVCQSLGIQIPHEYQAAPDHVVLLLELLDFLRLHAPVADAREFARSHFDWLEDYRTALQARLQHEDDQVLVRVGAFYDALLAYAQQYVGRIDEAARPEGAGDGRARSFQEDAEGVLVHG